MSDKLQYEELHAGLQELISDKVRKEHECGEYLEYLPDYLCRDDIYLETVAIDKEDIGRTGRLDVAFCAKVQTSEGEIRKRAYLWELKAPQVRIFCDLTNSRLCPSTDLVEVENQLIWYFHERKTDAWFAKRYDIQAEDIIFGGIVIGNYGTELMAIDKSDPSKAAYFYRMATSIRKEYFWNRCNIKFATWNSILDLFKPRIEGQYYPGDQNNNKTSIEALIDTSHYVNSESTA